MKIEKANLSDVEELSSLYYQLTKKYPEHNKMKPIFDLISKDKNYYLLVALNQENKAVGTAMGVICYDLIDLCAPFMLIENVVVSESYRGQGIGKMLMLELEAIAYSNKCALIILVSGNARKEAHTFYENLGYPMVKGFKKKLTYDE
ncbi:GNAT family N-acetyltransferase [Desulfovibrio litoralis]|uniref:Acetyltransferase (GNAT) family protein n=1 Tax=Desulfovibrio litoralis DSM 11393 TaxID=1121455 RepID=A0A1M7SCN6_9BACT|nr:GNAT family N-acetyltransferase [Desulfovibrio litoralis]SHN56246.1 Acetyltransferase (GNAT) family protein [Desulfovibrio litoralis DSM 11393]